MMRWAPRRRPGSGAARLEEFEYKGHATRRASERWVVNRCGFGRGCARGQSVARSGNASRSGRQATWSILATAAFRTANGHRRVRRSAERGQARRDNQSLRPDHEPNQPIDPIRRCARARARSRARRARAASCIILGAAGRPPLAALTLHVALTSSFNRVNASTSQVAGPVNREARADTR